MAYEVRTPLDFDGEQTRESDAENPTDSISRNECTATSVVSLTYCRHYILETCWL